MKVGKTIMENYSVKIRKCSKELTPLQKISLKDVSDSVSLGEIKENEQVLIKPDLYAIIDIHNEKSENKDYSVYVIVDKDGTKYTTSSENFFSTFENIMEEVEDADEEFDYSIKVFTKPSKNYKGKAFLTCTII